MGDTKFHKPSLVVASLGEFILWVGLFESWSDNCQPEPVVHNNASSKSSVQRSISSLFWGRILELSLLIITGLFPLFELITTSSSTAYFFCSANTRTVKKDKNSKGILICGGGHGMSMVANRQKGIRASLGYSIQAAKISRKDNDSNVLCLASRELKKKEALKIVNTFLKTPFSKLKRHQRRIKKI